MKSWNFAQVRAYTTKGGTKIFFGTKSCLETPEQLYRVFFSKGPTQKSFKYGIGPSQQDKIRHMTGRRRGGMEEWPAISPDLFPADYWFHGYLKVASIEY